MRSHLVRRSLAAATTLVVAGAVTAVAPGGARRGTVPAPIFGGPRPAAAEVVHAQGFRASVDGFRGWFGSYALGDLGTVWCVDHGPPAPDAAFGYVAADLAERAADTKRAMAWAVGVHSRGVDRIGAAALMLVLHDLMGAGYPSGRLSLDTLSPTALEGFDGREAEVVDRARHIRADAVAHARHEGPLALQLTVEHPDGSGAGTVVATVVDARGAGVAGVPVRLAGGPGVELAESSAVVTGAGGTAPVGFRAPPGEHRVDATATVPHLALQSFAPSARPAQRVVRPATSELSATATIGVPLPARLSVHKRGDASPYLPVAGARFVVERPDDGMSVGELTTDPSGLTAEVTLPPGRYRVVETVAPPGYTVAGPWDVELSPGVERVLEVADRARQGRVAVQKVDSRSGAPVPGAELVLRYDADRDGTYETALPAVRSTEAPVPIEGLRPGDYELEEVRAPAHYRRAPPQRTSVAAGADVTLTVADIPLATAAFVKVPAGPAEGGAPSLAGAALRVRDGAGGDIGWCVTAHDGRCSLPDDALEGRRAYCVSEEVAPPGWAIAPPVCFTTGGPGSVTTVTIEEHRLPPAPPAEATVVERAERAGAPPATVVEEVVPPATPTVTATLTAAAPPSPAKPSAPRERSGELPRTGAAAGGQAGAAGALIGLGVVLRTAGTRSARRARQRARRLRRRRRGPVPGWNPSGPRIPVLGTGSRDQNGGEAVRR